MGWVEKYVRENEFWQKGEKDIAKYMIKQIESSGSGFYLDGNISKDAEYVSELNLFMCIWTSVLETCSHNKK